MNDMTQLDDLLNRIAERSAHESDWELIAARAMHDPDVWRQVNTALRVDASIDQSVDQLAEIADSVELPATRSARRPHRTIAGSLAWTGWAAAAILALAFFVLSPPARNAPLETSSGAHAATTIELTADEAWKAYLRAGRDEGVVLNELPLMTVQAARAADGEGMEIVYVRRVVERARVNPDRVFRVASDEHGRPVHVPAGDLLRQRRNSL